MGNFTTTNEREKMAPNLNLRQNLSPIINPKTLKAIQNAGDFNSFNPFINVQKIHFQKKASVDFDAINHEGESEGEINKSNNNHKRTTS